MRKFITMEIPERLSSDHTGNKENDGDQDHMPKLRLLFSKEQLEALGFKGESEAESEQALAG